MVLERQHVVDGAHDLAVDLVVIEVSRHKLLSESGGLVLGQKQLDVTALAHWVLVLKMVLPGQARFVVRDQKLFCSRRGGEERSGATGIRQGKIIYRSIILESFGCHRTGMILVLELSGPAGNHSGNRVHDLEESITGRVH